MWVGMELSKYMLLKTKGYFTIYKRKLKIQMLQEYRVSPV